MSKKQKFDLRLFFEKPHRKLFALLILIFLFGAAAVILFIPKNLELSYGGDNCIWQPMIAPASVGTDSAGYKVRPTGVWKIGSVSLLSTNLCFEPIKSPTTGDYGIWVGPADAKLAPVHITISVPKLPVVRAINLGAPVPAGKTVQLQLSTIDQMFDYRLAANSKEVRCGTSKSLLKCDLTGLGLSYGAKYDLVLDRYFEGQIIDKPLKASITTLTATKITSFSIQPGQTIYDAPTQFTMTADKKLKSARAEITGGTTAIGVTTSVDGQQITLTLDKPLGREQDYSLIVRAVEAEDGSGLDQEQAISFKTSGGPKITNVSIGANSVASGQKVIVTFDQPIDESVNINDFAKLSGIDGSVYLQSATQVAFQLRGGDQCQPFQLSVLKGLKSGSNGEPPKDNWAFNSRIVCGRSSIIGRSVEGRSIVAYYFGSGNKTILFTGGIHGSEPSGYSTMQALVWYLQANAGGVIPAGTQVVIVPNANPDGIAKLSRNNVHNVNIDRNFPTANWENDIDTSSGLIVNGGGTSAGSEPEAQALMSLTRQLRPRLEVSFHAQGSLVGANKYSDSVTIGNIYSSTVGYGTMYYNAEDIMGGYAMTGEYEDWMGEEMNIPAILIELPTSSGNYINSQLSAILKMIKV